MNSKLISLTVAAALFVGCNASVSTPPVPSFQTPQEDTSFPKFLFQDIQGTVYGQPWAIKSGVVRQFGSGAQKEIIMYAEVPANPCSKAFFSTLPTISYVLLENFKAEEYRTDMSAPNGNNPAVFTDMNAQDQNVIAEKTRIVVNDITSVDMSISFYAKGSDSTGSASEVNGSYIVKICP